MSNNLEDEVKRLKEELNLKDELLNNLRVPLEVIHHEFNSLNSKFRSSIGKLNKKYQGEEIERLKLAYVNLDSYITCMLPFQDMLRYEKRLTRVELVELESIYIYLYDIFKYKLESSNISLLSTYGYDCGKMSIPRYIISSVMVNLINNAIYFLRDVEGKDRVIRLHYDVKCNELYISNNGKAIEDSTKLFTKGYSTKNSTGLGLWSSRNLLNRVGFNLDLCEPRKDATVSFVIRKVL